MFHRVFIGIGSNLGKRRAHYQRALGLIAALPKTRVVKQSSLYESEPIGEAKNWYVNGVIEIDTANLAEIREAHAWGVVDGVTTNPSLVAKSGRTLESVIKEICAIVDGPISAEVVSVDTPGMVEEGKRLAAIHANVVVKVP